MGRRPQCPRPHTCYCSSTQQTAYALFNGSMSSIPHDMPRNMPHKGQCAHACVRVHAPRARSRERRFRHPGTSPVCGISADCWESVHVRGHPDEPVPPGEQAPPLLLTRGDEVGRERRRRLGARLASEVAGEVHGDCKLVRIEVAISVDVGEVPDLSQRVHRQPRPLQDRPDRPTADQPVDRVERREHLIVSLLVRWCDRPTGWAAKGVDGASKWTGWGRGGDVLLVSRRRRGSRWRRRRRLVRQLWRRRLFLRGHVCERRGYLLARALVGALLREHGHQTRDVRGEHILHALHRLHVQLGELGELMHLHCRAELVDVREVTHRDACGAVNLKEVVLEPVEQLFLRLVLAPVRWHLLLQVTDDVHVRLCEPHALH
mmetsp:Transcript_28091/g.63589  ORF Transcript_28091/g.63589 Transcript_28091/m.63589 type:complete len:375 (-) Transcript_28091:890-2014(-)